MSFLWPEALWLTLALPALVGAYLRLRRGKDERPLRYAGFSLVREAIGRTHWMRPHVPPLILLLGLAALFVAIARPALVFMPPAEQGTVILLMDVSLSMAATDVPPTRLDAAKAAAKTFVEAQPRDIRIGVVAFGGHADLVQAPTSSRADVMRAIDELELQRFTAIGAGLIGALLTLVPDAEIRNESDIFGAGRMPGGAPDRKRHKPVAPGSDLTTAIILVSDGRSTMGISALQAAKLTADHGIRVFTVGVGTLYGGVAHIEGWAPIHAEFDDATLRKIADVTRGEYFEASNAGKLRRIYESLVRRVVFERKEVEITALCAAIGAVLTLASAGLSLVWFNRQA